MQLKKIRSGSVKESQSAGKRDPLVTQIYEAEDEGSLYINKQYLNPKKLSAETHGINDVQSMNSSLIMSKNKQIGGQNAHINDVSIINAGSSSLNDSLMKVGLKQYLHHQSSTSSQQLRIFQGGKKKRQKSDKEDVQFFRSPYHEKKYLGNEIFPPEPPKIQQIPKSDQDLFTFKPHINNPSYPNRNSAKNQPYVIGEVSPNQHNMELELIEYKCSPVAIKNNFKNNPGCLHSLANKNIVRKTNSVSNSSANFVFMRTINLAENRKALYEGQSLPKQMGKKSSLKDIRLLQNPIIKPGIKQHTPSEFKLKGINEIGYSQSAQQTQKGSQRQDNPRFSSATKSVENMNNFSIAKNNLIKYANNLKL